MIRLTLAALAVTIALPALANGDWPDKPEQPVKEEPVKPDPKPEPETPEPPAPEPETPEPEPETPTPEPEPETPEPPGCPDCENPPPPQLPEPRDRYTPQASDRETQFARVPPCCTRDGVIVAKRTLFGIGQGKAVEYCAKVAPAKIPACDVKVKP